LANFILISFNFFLPFKVFHFLKKRYAWISAINQLVKRSYLKTQSNGYLQEIKRLASKQISVGQGGFKHKS